MIRYPDQPLAKATMPPEQKARLAGYWWLAQIAEQFRAATTELSASLGVPLCVDGCGLCCTSNTPMAYGVEVDRAASWLLEQTPETRTRILDRIENWLQLPILALEHPMDPTLTIKNPKLGKASPGQRTEVVRLEVLTAQRGRCPLLGDDLRCTVYDVRPMGCRAWGITTQPAPWCQRPEGMGEDDNHRAVFAGPGTVHLRALVRGMIEAVQSQPNLVRAYVFPTALYAHFRSARLIAMIDRIPTARLVGGREAFRPHLFDEPMDGPIEIMNDGSARAVPV